MREGSTDFAPAERDVYSNQNLTERSSLRRSEMFTRLAPLHFSLGRSEMANTFSQIYIRLPGSAKKFDIGFEDKYVFDFIG